jgi:acylphosphatase
MNKCYGVTVEGKVQDIGFRGLVENIARSNYLAGIVFNDKDESVKMIVRGEVSVINDFFNEIQTKGTRRGIILNITNKKELALDIPLPLVFTKVNADDEIDIGKKLDKGNDLLFLLVEGQNTLVEGQNDIKSILSSMDKTLKLIAKKGEK